MKAGGRIPDQFRKKTQNPVRISEGKPANKLSLIAK